MESRTLNEINMLFRSGPIDNLEFSEYFNLPRPKKFFKNGGAGFSELKNRAETHFHIFNGHLFGMPGNSLEYYNLDTAKGMWLGALFDFTNNSAGMNSEDTKNARLADFIKSFRKWLIVYLEDQRRQVKFGRKWIFEILIEYFFTDYMNVTFARTSVWETPPNLNGIELLPIFTELMVKKLNGLSIGELFSVFKKFRSWISWSISRFENLNFEDLLECFYPGAAEAYRQQFPKPGKDKSYPKKACGFRNLLLLIHISQGGLEGISLETASVIFDF